MFDYAFALAESGDIDTAKDIIGEFNPEPDLPRLVEFIEIATESKNEELINFAYWLEGIIGPANDYCQSLLDNQDTE